MSISDPIVVYEYSSTVPVGEVIRSDPPAGTEDVNINDPVTLYISLGPGVVDLIEFRASDHVFSFSVTG